MEFFIVHPPKCLSNIHIFDVEREFWDEFSKITYDGEGELAWPEHLDYFHVLMENTEGFNETKVYTLLAHTLRDYPFLWCSILPHNSLHSFKQFNDLIESIFHHFYFEALDKKMLKQWKAPHESLEDFKGTSIVSILKL